MVERNTPSTNDTEASEPSDPVTGKRLTTGLMFGGLFAAYGTLAAIMVRFLFPSRPPRRDWMYVSNLEGFEPGSTVGFRTPSGESINITRTSDGSSHDAFVALSSVCPHLGCQVHWEPQNSRYFCPCHNGAFAPDGSATEGPPAEDGQSLIEYPLRVRNGLLFVEVAASEVAKGPGTLETPGGPPGPGHDPCLYAKRDV